jgi:hypothetical protein
MKNIKNREEMIDWTQLNLLMANWGKKNKPAK